MRTDDILVFMVKRHRIYLERQKGASKPWTDDQILQKYRFCNVYRELDAVTIWIRENWREPYERHPNLVFAMCMARLFNRPYTLGLLGFPETAKFEEWREKLHRQQAAGAKVFNPAYIVSTNGRAMNKVDYVLDVVLKPIYDAQIPLRHGTICEFLFELLNSFQGMGSFMSAQVVADCKYTPAMRGSFDWLTFARSGPGSRRGMNRLLGCAPDMAWREVAWYEALKRLWDELMTQWPEWMPKIHMQDLQNCLCEFDKYERVRLGEGTPKQLYNGRA